MTEEPRFDGLNGGWVPELELETYDMATFVCVAPTCGLKVIAYRSKCPKFPFTSWLVQQGFPMGFKVDTEVCQSMCPSVYRERE